MKKLKENLPTTMKQNFDVLFKEFSSKPPETSYQLKKTEY